MIERTGKTKNRNPESTGFLVLGMHRSGTSVLTRLLQAAGANPGQRLIGGSQGNEEGHWEDAFAVETNDRLLHALGYRWDDPRPLPEGWQASAAAREAGAAAAGYARSVLSQQPVWVLKDPRLCLVGEIWVAALREAGLVPSAIVLSRHPSEVAESLQVRDGMAAAKAHLLWLRYSLAAERVSRGLPRHFTTYPCLLDDSVAVLASIARLPGGDRLNRASETVSEAFVVDPRKRHHAAHEADAATLPDVFQQAWQLLSSPMPDSDARVSAFDAVLANLTLADALYAPVLCETERERQVLWERTARAEAGVSAEALTLTAIPAELVQLRELVQISGASSIQAIGAQTQALSSNQSALLAAISDDLRQMQAAVTEASSEAEKLRVEAALARAISPQLQALTEGIEQNRSALVNAISDDLRQMQATTAEASAEAEKLRAEAALARTLAPQLQALTEGIEMNRSALVNAISDDLRQMQRQVSHWEVRAMTAESRLLTQETLLQRLEDASAERTRLEQLLASQSVDHQRALAVLRHDLNHLRSLAAQVDVIKASRSWRLTRPLRALGRLLRGQPLRTAAAPASRHDIIAPEPASAETPAAVLATAQPGLPDVFVWAVIDWHFRFQRPQHLAQALAAKGHRVFYISNNFIDSTEPGFQVDPLSSDGRLFQIHLHLEGKPPIYFGLPTDAQIEALRASLGALLAWSVTTRSVSLVQHPYWSAVVRAVPGAQVVYDCMDHHGGFENNAPVVLTAESRLVAESDLVIVTSGWLMDEIGPQARAVAMIRNAGEYAFFRIAPSEVFRDARGRQVIGYYGAIAEWFDVELVRKVAKAHADALVVLVGSDTAGAGSQLADLDNVQLIGEVPYAQLPYWLHGFDVCLLPFKVIPLTLATNPVKVYEYLSAGKPVVSVDLPEMAQFEGLVRTAADADAFVSAVTAALHENGEAVAARQAFAAEQTWAHRAEALDHALATLPEPRVSVIVLTYNNLAFTEACLFSIEAYSDYRNLEVIVVDNASSDGSPEWLAQWAEQTSVAGHQRRLILNEDNLGFSAGNNVGLRAATGEVLILLNNDTYVTPGWVRGLCNHLRDNPSLGLIGPVTNNIGNEARIEIAYADMAEMIHRAGSYTRSHPGQLYPLRTAAFFCVAMRREVYQQVGDMDEAFGVGFFEDDDYCRRIEQVGLTVACAEDVFVHHHLSASFDALKAEKKQELFERNKVIYEAKWGAWVPHVYRPDH